MNEPGYTRILMIDRNMRFQLRFNW